MGLTTNVEWALSLSPAEALTALQSALERMDTVVSTRTESGFVAHTSARHHENRSDARWEVSVEQRLRGSEVAMTVVRRVAITVDMALHEHSALLDDLANQPAMSLLYGESLRGFGKRPRRMEPQNQDATHTPPSSMNAAARRMSGGVRPSSNSRRCATG